MEQEAAGRGLSLPPQWLRDLARRLVEVEPPPGQGSMDLAGEDGGLGAVGEGASGVLPVGAHDAERGCSHCRTDGCPECWTIVGRRRRLRRGAETDRLCGVRAGQEDCLSSPGVVTPPPGRPGGRLGPPTRSSGGRPTRRSSTSSRNPFAPLLDQPAGEGGSGVQNADGGECFDHPSASGLTGGVFPDAFGGRSPAGASSRSDAELVCIPCDDSGEEETSSTSISTPSGPRGGSSDTYKRRRRRKLQGSMEGHARFLQDLYRRSVRVRPGCWSRGGFVGLWVLRKRTTFACGGGSRLASEDEISEQKARARRATAWYENYVMLLRRLRRGWGARSTVGGLLGEL